MSFFLTNYECFHVVSGDFNAHSGEMSDIGYIDDDIVSNLIPENLEIDVRICPFSLRILSFIFVVIFCCCLFLYFCACPP